MWGGDTKVRAEDKQDENLYLLNLSTREWTRVRHSPDNPDAGPVGRYGHTVAIVGSRFFVFGGQVDGSFMNDLWAFDLNSLKSTPSWELIRPTGGNLPPRRTGHASVTHKDRIYIFGGTDGQYHYNDTWAYDITTNTWEELSCIGYIPVPREGHATCLVDDVMYIFGGRGVDGRDLGDLASFKISNQRWYMFANMGPSPSGRSGHVLTTYQNKVVVLGGESFAGGKPDDPAIVYVLDTVKIKYPADNKGASTQQGSRKIGSGGAATGVPGQAGAGASQGPVIDPTRAASPPVQDPRRAASPTQGIRPAQPPNGLLTMMQQGAASPEQAVAARAAPRPPGAQPGQIEPPVRAMSPTQQAVRDQRAAALQTGGAPGQPPPSITAVQQQADNLSGPGSSSGHAQGAYNGARSQRSMENLRGQAASPSSVGISAQLEALRKREAWMRAALTLAAKKGFVAPEQLELPDGTSAGSRSSELNIEDIDTGVDGSDKQRIIRALVTLKTQLADAKGTISQQAQNEATRLTEADRARQTAMQEAAFYRAKVHAMESSNPTEVSRLERERTTRMEQQLSDALRENAELVRQTNRARDEVVLEKQLRSAAEERLSETAKRAMAAEAAQMRAHEELAALQKRSHLNESTLRDYQERVTTLTSTAARHQADHETSRSQLDDANMALERHVTALTDLQAALAAATSRAAEHERMHTQHRELVEQHEGTLNRLRSELNSKSLETDSHSRRVKELETLLSRHREEAETHRLASTNGLAQVLQFHQQRNTTRSTNELAPQMEQKVRALTDETTSLRALHSESKAHAEATATALQDMRDRNIGLEKQHSGLRSELSAMRSQLAIALQEVGRLKDQASSKDVELRERSRAAEEAEVMTSLLKQFMKERGLAVPGDEELSAKSGYADKRIRELEDEIDARTEDAREAQRRLQEAVGKADALERDLASARSASGSAGGADTEALERRAANAERELAEAVASHRERMATLENDYNTAVSFVKGTEKMLRRMKDELTRFKTENATLQSENASLRAGVEPGVEAATEAARDIEALRNRLVDVTAQSEEVAIENRELERRLATLISEQKEAHDRSRDLQDSRADSTRRQNELETEISRLESNLNSVRRELQETHTLNQHLSNELTQASRSGTAPSAGTASIARDLNTAQAANDQLRGENANLAHRLQETEDKLQLLLGRVESNHEGDNVRYSQASISSELDAWEKANNSGTVSP
ncbi:Kelch repeat-containing proteins [Ceraceosorus bombacis]|uniref:Kelch repeat-containing proteins n=1 Tax=Ceraceosorus bombacis TaxID=401625 RepID=A0A0P1BHR8_9BASI|nr:Kelch repeat-containing proteins [Ceraceosorus bombacis]